MRAPVNKKTHEEFIEEVNKKHPNKYDVLGKYVNWDTKVLIKYIECSHEKETAPSSILKGIGCKKCSDKRLADGRRKDHKTFSEEFSEALGYEYILKGKYRGNKHKIEVEHAECGNTFSKIPSDLLRGRGCPTCKYKRVSERMTATNEEFLDKVREIDPLGEYIFHDEYKGSYVKLRYTHIPCGKYHKIDPNHFFRGRGCPRCSKVHKPTSEEFVDNVEKLYGNEYIIEGEYVTAKTKIKVRHRDCGRVYEVSPDNLLRGRRCPLCKESKGEKGVREVLENLGIEFLQEWRIGGTDSSSPRFDFYIPTLRACIEYDGEQHVFPIETWGGTETFSKVIKRDTVKNHYCHYRGIELLRIPYWQFDNIPEIVTEFINELEAEGGRPNGE